MRAQPVVFVESVLERGLGHTELIADIGLERDAVVHMRIDHAKPPKIDDDAVVDIPRQHAVAERIAVNLTMPWPAWTRSDPNHGWRITHRQRNWILVSRGLTAVSFEPRAGSYLFEDFPTHDDLAEGHWMFCQIPAECVRANV